MAATLQRVEIRPNPGPQEVFLATPADIAIYGGAAGGGKTWALLLDPLRHVRNPNFGAVYFRRSKPQILNEGGLWDESTKLYPHLQAIPRMDPLGWQFPGPDGSPGAKIRFASLQYETDKLQWQGSQIPAIYFDELTHFTEGQFFYLLSRNRSLCGVRPYIRGSTNPDALSWVKVFLAPWLDHRFPNPAASGEIRYFVRDGGQILWVDAGTPDAKSVTFVRSSVYDNPKLLAANPEYLANLKAMSVVDRARLLDGDWDIVPGGNFFKREWFGEPLAVAPRGLRLVRFWDLAATEAKPGKDPDWTVGALVGKSVDGNYYILDIQRVRASPGTVEGLIKQTAFLDRQTYGAVHTHMEQEPGSSGVIVIKAFTKLLDGYAFFGHRSTGPKEERAKPVSAQAEAGNVRLVAGLWNNDLLNELSAFPSPEVHDDQVDALSGAFGILAGTSNGRPTAGAARPAVNDHRTILERGVPARHPGLRR